MSENLSKLQLLWLIISFNLGSAILLVPAALVNTAEQDAWISLILGALFSIPILLTISKLACLYPNMSLVQYSEAIMGKLVGKIVGIVWCWFAMHLGFLVLRNFNDFIQTTIMPRTPDLAISFVMLVPIVLVLFSGLSVLGIIAQLISPLVLFFFVGITFTMIPDFDINKILPVFQADTKDIVWGSIQVMSFPFGETVLLASLLAALKDKHGCSNILVKGVIFAALLLLLGLVRTMLALGIDETQRLYYAVLEPSRRESFQFFRGLEVFIIINWFVFAFFKVTVCLYAFCRGFANLMGTDNYKPLVIPAGLIMIYLSILSFNNIAEQIHAAQYFWPVYALTIEALIPLFLLIIASIKGLRGKRRIL